MVNQQVVFLHQQYVQQYNATPRPVDTNTLPLKHLHTDLIITKYCEKIPRSVTCQ